MKIFRTNLLKIIVLLLFTTCNPEKGDVKNPKNFELYISLSFDQTASVSPNGKLIAYYHQEFEFPMNENYLTGLYIMNIDGSNQRLLLEGNHFSPDWSPDGKWIVFTSKGTLQIINLEGDNLRTFQGVNDVPLYHPDWSPDGSSIIFSSPFVDGGGFFICDPSFQNVKQLFDHYELSGSDPNWSIDGKKMLYCKNISNSDDLFVIDTAGISDIRLTNSNKTDREPVWSPDGSKICWSSSVEIYVMDADGENPYRLDYGKDPCWTPDGKHVIYSFANEDYSRGVLYKINISTKEKTQLTF